MLSLPESPIDLTGRALRVTDRKNGLTWATGKPLLSSHSWVTLKTLHSGVSRGFTTPRWSRKRSRKTCWANSIRRCRSQQRNEHAEARVYVQSIERHFKWRVVLARIAKAQ